MKQKPVLKPISEPPMSPDKYCPRCGQGVPRRTHEKRIERTIHYTLCRCTNCWAVYWAAEVGYLEIEPSGAREDN